MSAQTHTVNASPEELDRVINNIREIIDGEVVGTAILAMLFLIIEGYDSNVGPEGVRDAMMKGSNAIAESIDQWNLINMPTPTGMVN